MHAWPERPSAGWRTAISRLENGHRAVTVPELVELAGALGVAVGSPEIVSEMSPAAARVAYERPVEVEPSRSRTVWGLGWRPDTLVAIYGLLILLMSRALQVGVQRLRTASNGLSGAMCALVPGLVDAVATVFLTAAVWTGLLVVWFALFGFMMNGYHQSANTALGPGETSSVLLAIMLGASMSGGGAYVLSLSIRGLIGRLVTQAQLQRIHHPV